jgi:putative molybdopterin biosynthesis protein
MEDFYLPRELAKKLRIHPATVYELIDKGSLKATKVGRQYRISPDEYQRFLKENTSNGNE